MDSTASNKFILSLSQYIQSLSNGYVEFIDSVDISGAIFVSADSGSAIHFTIDEKGCKLGSDVSYISHSCLASSSLERFQCGSHAIDSQDVKHESIVTTGDSVTQLQPLPLSFPSELHVNEDSLPEPQHWARESEEQGGILQTDTSLTGELLHTECLLSKGLCCVCNVIYFVFCMNEIK